MDLLCIGINHRTAPLNIRESVWYSNEEVGRVLPAFKEKNLRECVFVSTCNRTELYATPNDQTNRKELLDVFIQSKNASHLAQPQHFYSLESLLAVRHLLSVSSGIDSMVLGDVQILSQMKEAFDLAHEAGTVGTILTKLFQTALHTGKRARTETEIGYGAVSVSYAAVELATKIFDDLSQRKALLIGVGETGKLTAKHLVGKQIGKLYLANRTRQHAENVASQLGGQVVEFDALKDALRQVDIVISSVNTPTHILSAQDIRTAMKHRSNNPLFIIDIGVPRNIDPSANKIGNVFLHDIDTLNIVVDRNLQKRQTEASKVQQIVHEEVLKFHQWYNGLQVTPTIQELRDQFESIRKQEVERIVHRFPSDQRESVEMLTKRIVNKILHTPMTNLKDGTNGEETEETLKKISTIRHLFGLGAKHERGKQGGHEE